MAEYEGTIVAGGDGYKLKKALNNLNAMTAAYESLERENAALKEELTRLATAPPAAAKPTPKRTTKPATRRDVKK